MNQAIIRARPDHVDVFRRRRNSVDHATSLLRRHLGTTKHADARRHFRLLTRQVGTDDLPTRTTVGRLEQNVAGKIQHARIGGRKENRRRAQKSVLPGAQDLRRDVLHLARVHIEPRSLAAVDEIRMKRIGRDVAILFNTDSTPVAESDRAVIAATLHARRAALLLPAVNPVRKLIVSDDVIELRRRLVVPGAPRLATIHADDCALVRRKQHDLRILGIDPKRVVIVAARCAFECRERFATVS